MISSSSWSYICACIIVISFSSCTVLINDGPSLIEQRIAELPVNDFQYCLNKCPSKYGNISDFECLNYCLSVLEYSLHNKELFCGVNNK